MKAKRLISTVNLGKEDWLKERRKGITASQVAGMMGMSKWDSPMSIYLDKIGELPLEKEDNEFMEWGRRIEGLVAEKFAENHPEYKIQKVNAILYNPEFPILLGDIDRLIIDKETKEKGVLEIKTVSEYGKDQWEGEEVPGSYLLQAATYMYILDVDYCYFACLCGGNKYIEKRVERDNELINMIIEAAKEFWERVETRNPPLIDGSEASTEVLSLLHPKAIEGSEIELDGEAEELCKQREIYKDKKKEIETIIDEIDNKIKQKLGNNEIGSTEHFIVKWSNVTTNRFDSKKFELEHKNLYDQYLKQSSYRKLGIKELNN